LTGQGSPTASRSTPTHAAQSSREAESGADELSQPLEIEGDSAEDGEEEEEEDDDDDGFGDDFDEFEEGQEGDDGFGDFDPGFKHEAEVEEDAIPLPVSISPYYHPMTNLVKASFRLVFNHRH
jgi:hypothetical protein